MANQYKMKWLLLISLLVCASLSMGCALGVTKVKVSHDPLNRIENKKDGNILINEFKDVRPRKKEYIGNKRNMYGMVLGHIGADEGVSLTEILTKYFAEALREAGYSVVVTKESKATKESKKIRMDAVIDGEIIEFWMDLYMAVWHKIAVKLTAKNPDSKEILWEKVIHGEDKNVLWVGATSEYESVIRKALTKALNNAASEFASEEFSKVLKPEKRPTTPEIKSIPITSPPTTIVTVAWTSANIRSGAGNNYPIVATVKQGDKLTVIGELGDWLNVRLGDGKEGWISNKVVK